MDLPTAHMLNELTRSFYDEAAASFSATREHPWPGWIRVMEAYSDQLHDRMREAGELRVLDLGCGNMRFERYLGAALPGVPVRAHAVDDCAPLAEASGSAMPENMHLTFQQMDVVAAMESGTLIADLPQGPYDLAVAFGFMHHLPLPAWRMETLRTLAELTRPGGLIVASFWQFLDDARLREKADEATARGCTARSITFDDPHDRLLGWQERNDIFRYCHHFAEEEIDRIVSNLSGVREVGRFSADGRSDLNRYVVLQRIR